MKKKRQINLKKHHERNKKTISSKQRKSYNENVATQINKKAQGIARYHENKYVKDALKKKYRDDEPYKKKHLEYINKKYKMDSTYRQKKLNAFKHKYKSDPIMRKKLKDALKVKYVKIKRCFES